MSARVPFINREEELATIKQAIGDYGKRKVIYIQAEGGIGKTRLLQEVRTQIQRLRDKPARYTPAREINVVVVNEYVGTEWADEFLKGVTEEAAAENIQLTSKHAAFNLDLMAAQLDEVIASQPDAIIIRLGTDEKLRPGIERALSQGIKILTVDNYLPHIEDLTSRITTDEQQGAYRSREQLVRDIDYHGEVAALLVQGVAMQESRKELLETMLAQYPDIELITAWVKMGEKMADIGYQKTLDLLEAHPDLKAIWVTWEEFTRGVVHALKDMDRTNVGVYSFDLLSESDVALMLEADSPWRTTVAVNAYIIGREALRLAGQAISGVAIERHYSMPMQLITQEALRNKKDPWSSLWDDFQIRLPSQVLVPDIIDFDEYALRNELSFALRVADLLGTLYFDDFYDDLRYFAENQMEGAEEERLKRLRAQVDQSFIKSLQQVTSQRRIVLLLDTIEKAHQVLHYIIKVVSAIDNIVVLIAGRPEPEETAKLIYDKWGAQVQTIYLQPLDMEARQKYLDKKQQLIHMVLDPKLAQKLLILAGGKPILIDLAVEWLVRRTPMKWLSEESLEELQRLSDESLQEREKEFEARLVHHIGDTRVPLDQLILTLAQVSPLDLAMIQELLKITREKAKKLRAEAGEHVFIKVLPNGELTLHDEMERLIEEHVWPDVDPDGERRHRLSEAAVNYLEEEIRRLNEQIKGAGEAHAAMEAEVSIWRADQANRERLWALREQLLHHKLVTAPSEGIHLFYKMFEEATDSYRYPLRLNWVKLVESHAEKLSQKDQYGLRIRQAKALLDDAQYGKAEGVLNVASELTWKPEQKVDVLIQKANVVIRRGRLEEGITYFEEAVGISRKHDLRQWLVKAENGLGWAYRLIARFPEARKHYEAALALALEEDLLKQQALLYNNLGFLYAYEKDEPGHQEIAERYCKEALRLAQKQEDPRSIGRAYSTLGCVTFMAGEIVESLDYFQKALDIFEPEHDDEWLSQVYSWRGAAYMSRQNFDRVENLFLAKKDFQRAAAIAIPKEQPMILSRLSLIYLLENNLDGAEKAAQASREAAFDLPDLRYQWISIRDRARVMRHKKEYHCYEELKDEMAEYLKERHSAPDARSHGMLHLELGSLALGKGENATAIEHYHEGMKILTRLERYGGDTPEVYLERLEKEVFLDNLALSKEQIREVGAQLLADWQKAGLHIRYPDVRNIYARWAQWEV